MIYNSNIFGDNNMEEEDVKLTDSLAEAFLIEETSHFTDQERKEFVESDLAQALVQEGRMRKKTIVLIGKNDDLERRKVLACIDAAKEANDPEYARYKKHRAKEKESLMKMVHKYQNRGMIVAKKSQKDYIRNRMPKTFGRLTDFGTNR